MRDKTTTGGAKRVLARLWEALKDSRGLINTTDVIVAAGATIILAAGVAAVGSDSFDQSKTGKGQSDAQSLANAMNKFFSDTGKWPGQAEILAQTADSTTGNIPMVFLTTGSPSTIGTTAFVPDSAASTFNTTKTATCQGMSLTGAAGVTFAAGSVSSTSGSNLLNVNDFLVRKPPESSYPNWKGPYLSVDVRSDPFDRVWLINVVPLFCAETVTITSTPTIGGASVADTTTAGTLGYGWILSGGPNRKLSTSIRDAKLDPNGDDVGMNLGKLIQRSAGGRNS